MPGIVPGFEYDIFISYRHYDNRSGWVTDFVSALTRSILPKVRRKKKFLKSFHHIFFQ
jgi:hypothetical protein